MIKNWKEIKRETAYDGYRKIVMVTFEQPDKVIKSFDIKVDPVVASVFALTKDHSVILATQFRPGPHRVFHELPGGMVEDGEEPAIAAKRELQEETGYRGKIIPLLGYSVCAYSTQRRHCFLALDFVRKSVNKT